MGNGTWSKLTAASKGWAGFKAASQAGSCAWALRLTWLAHVQLGDILNMIAEVDACIAKTELAQREMQSVTCQPLPHTERAPFLSEAEAGKTKADPNPSCSGR